MEILILLLFLAILLVPSDSLLCLPVANKHVPLFIFGDSLFDPGNNNYINTSTDFQANYWPYGMSYFKYPTGRFSDGRLIPDILAEYMNLPHIPPYRQPGNHQFINGANFASGGSGALVETHPGSVIPLNTQLQDFQNVQRYLKQNLGDKETKLLLSKALYLFSVGGNDYFSYTSNPSISHAYSGSEYVTMVIGNITKAIKEIYIGGGRKFGFVNMGPLGCLPSRRTPGGECYENLMYLASLHNDVFLKILEKLEKKLKGFQYSVFDCYTNLQERINSPSEYGFEEGKSACCGSGPYRGTNSCGGKRGVEEYELCANTSAYVFFDCTHPSEMTFQQLAKLMWNGTADVTWPYNLKELVECNRE